MTGVKSWDVIIIGGGLIGLSLGLALRKHGVSVLIVERGQPGAEASSAAAGMLAHCDPHTPPLLQPLALASAKLYPEFVHEIEDESGDRIDLRRDGTLFLLSPDSTGSLPNPCCNARAIDATELGGLEPGLRFDNLRAFYLPEAAVDPRQLTTAVLKAAKHRGVDLAAGTTAIGLVIENARIVGVRTERTEFHAAAVVNCAGAWAGEIAPRRVLTHPVKGQMLSVAVPIKYDVHGTPAPPHILRHVVRAPGVYMVPRTDGRIIIGSTLEDAGFDKHVDPVTIRRLRAAAAQYSPAIAETRILESWAGLRPATPDKLPILGATAVEGYFIATGHYRDGILLAPITAQLMGHVIRGLRPELDISAFTPARFS